MATFELDADFTANFIPYRHGIRWTAKGTVYRRGKPVEIFEAHGYTLPDATEAAKAKAQEIVERLKAPKRAKTKKKVAKKHKR